MEEGRYPQSTEEQKTEKSKAPTLCGEYEAC